MRSARAPDHLLQTVGYYQLITTVLQFYLFLKKAHALFSKFLIFDLPEKDIFNINPVDTMFWAGKSLVLRGMFSR